MHKDYKADMDKLMMAKLIMEENYRRPLTLEQLASKVNMDARKMSICFKRLFNKSLNDYLKEVRVKKAKIYLESSVFPVQKISQLIGIPNSSHFIKYFKDSTGVTPHQWRTKIKSMDASLQVYGDGRLKKFA